METLRRFLARSQAERGLESRFRNIFEPRDYPELIDSEVKKQLKRGLGAVEQFSLDQKLGLNSSETSILVSLLAQKCCEKEWSIRGVRVDTALWVVMQWDDEWIQQREEDYYGRPSRILSGISQKKIGELASSFDLGENSEGIQSLVSFLRGAATYVTTYLLPTIYFVPIDYYYRDSLSRERKEEAREAPEKFFFRLKQEIATARDLLARNVLT